MKQKTVGLTLRAFIVALALILVAGSPALPPFDGVAYAQTAAPANLEATTAPDNSSVSLSWDAVSGASSYEVYRGVPMGNRVDWGTAPVSPIGTPSTNSYDDESITAGATYTYGVRAAGCSAASCWAYVTVDIPSGQTPITGNPVVTLTPVGTDAVDVAWTPVTGAGVSYQIQFWHSGLGNSWERITGTQTTPHRHSGLTPGTEYFYVVRAFRGNEEVFSDWQADNSKITLQATTDTPVLDLAHTSRTVVELDWTPAPAGSTYDLQRRKVTTDSATPAVMVPADAVTGWARLPSGLLTDTDYTDSAANYVPDTTGTAPFFVSYEYRVRAVSSNGVEGDWSNVKSANIPPAGGVVGTPTISSASAVSSSSTRVTWGAVTGAAFYEIQWKTGDGNYTNALRVDALTYEHLGLSPATTYTYKVRAQDINGPGAYSSAVPATTLSVTAAAGQMPKVTGLMVTDETTDNAVAERMAKLTWNAVSGATHYDIQRYDPSTPASWQDLANSDGSTRIDAASSPTHTDTFATGANGMKYFYVVSAVDDRGDGAGANDDLGEWSDYKSVEFLDFAPTNPTALAASKTNGNSILVRWTAPAVSGTDGTATSYTIHYRTNETTTWSPISVPSGTSYHHTGLRGNTTYFYRVRAENSGGMSAFHPAPGETEVSVTLGNTLTAPTGLRAMDATTGTTPGIKVSWNMASGADRYEIQRFNPTDNMWGDLTGTAEQDTDVSPGTMTSTTDANSLTASTTYLYRVRTVQETAMSGWSTPVSGTTRAAAPAVPTLVATTTGQSMIRLSWTAVMGATSYHLEWLEGAQAHADFEDVNTNPARITIGGNFSNYVHTGRKAGTQYSYRLRAVLPTGNGDWTSAGGSPQTVQPFTKPAAPDLTATATDSDTITLTWDAVPVGSGHVAADGYRVEWRIRNSGDDWAALDAGETPTCDAANKCMVADDGLTASTHYQYRIRAEAADAVGGHNSYWDYTNQRTPAASN